MRNSRIYTCHLQNELHVPGICGFINYNTVSTEHLWGDFRQQEQRNCQHRIAGEAFGRYPLRLAELFPPVYPSTSRFAPASLGLEEGMLWSAFHNKSPAPLCNKVWWSGSAWHSSVPRFSTTGEGPLGERGAGGRAGVLGRRAGVLHMRLRTEDPVHFPFICLCVALKSLLSLC